MKIQLEPEDWPDIFEDNEFCKKENKKCEFLKELRLLSVCRLFKNESGSKMGLIYSEDGIQEKCQKCKDAYKKAILKQGGENINLDEIINNAGALE